MKVRVTKWLVSASLLTCLLSALGMGCSDLSQRAGCTSEEGCRGARMCIDGACRSVERVRELRNDIEQIEARGGRLEGRGGERQILVRE